jgi:hypothetical protein
MRRVMLLAALLAMALVAAAPAFAQTTEAEVQQEAEQTGVVEDSVCSQVFNIAVQQYNAGDQVAEAESEAEAEAEAEDGTAAAVAISNAEAANIANALGIDIDTVNVCLNNFTVTATPTAKTVTPTATVPGKAQYKKVVFHKGKKVVPEKVISVKGKKHVVVVKGKTVTATATVTPTPTPTPKATVTATPTATAKVLPPTGGASLLALGAGVLLVGGALVARRIAR